LEVRTNDEKTVCEQTFMGDGDADVYTRSGVITSSIVGETTVYSVTFGDWTTKFATESYVQTELEDYLPLSGGTLTGDVQGVTPQLGDDSPSLATTEFVQDELDNHLNNYLPLTGGTMTGSITLPDGGNPLSTAGGTMTGQIKYAGLTATNYCIGRTEGDGSYDIGWYDSNGADGAFMALRSADFTGYSGGDGEFVLGAKNDNGWKTLNGHADGTLKWDNKTVIVGTEYSESFQTNKLAANASQDFSLTAQPKYWSIIVGSGAGWGGLIWNMNSAKVLRVTNKNTSALSENVNFTIKYIV
jgi:hypothetical protein